MSGNRDGLPEAGYAPAGAEESVLANRAWWDDEASEYLADHGAFLGADRFVWGPEGLTEDEAQLLGPIGDLIGRRVLEIGCGAAQCSRWLATRGVQAVGIDLSIGMLNQTGPVAPGDTADLDDAADPDGASRTPGLVQADARRLPFADATFDHAFSAYGAVPFVADPEQIMSEVARVLRPGGRWVFSVTHPMRWAFPDDPSERGLTAVRSYFDTRPYIERDAAGRLSYAEHHRTLGERIRDIVRAGLELVDLIEPRWPAGHDRIWGGGSPLRGRLLPGTAIFVARKPT